MRQKVRAMTLADVHDWCKVLGVDPVRTVGELFSIHERTDVIGFQVPARTERVKDALEIA